MQTAEDIRALQEEIAAHAYYSDQIRQQLHKIIIGQQHMIDRLLIGLYCNGHVLLEGVPGLYARPLAGGCDRHHDLSPAKGRVRS